MIGVLIINSEPLARTHITRLIESHRAFEVMAELRSAREAVEAVRRLQPAVVFLDLELSDVDFFDPRVLREREPATVLILTTANEDCIPRPIHVYAFDSLMKPFDSERFDRVLALIAAYLGQGDRLQGQHLRLLAAFPQESEAVGAGARPRRYADRVLVREGDRIRFIKVRDIDRIEAHGSTVRLCSGGRVYALGESLEGIARRLDPRQFLSVRRSLLVNLDRLEPLEAVN